MIATIDLSSEEIEFLTVNTCQEDIGAALRKATDEYIRYRKRMNLVDYDGEVEFEEKRLVLMEDAEAEEQEKRSKVKDDRSL